MSALPPPLSRWAALSELLAHDAAGALLPWIDALDRALGPLRAEVIVGDGEPDGVDGVTRRAPFDRLLDTERLLATEVPDEFVRRAAQRELLFHALALKTRRPPRASLMLVDAGPSQLGAPRLVHLALALTLARRAEDVGARFAWGLLQDPPRDEQPPRLVMSTSPSDCARLITSRRALPSAPDDRAAWERFALRAGWDDLWVVGADCAPAARRGGGAIRVRDPVRPDATHLEVEVDHHGRVAHRCLALPAPALQARILREPASLFVRPAPPPPRDIGGLGRADDVVAAPPRFAGEGRKLIARNARGDALVFAVPTDGLRSPRPRRWTRAQGEQLIAAGWTRKRLVLLARRGDALLRFDWRGDLFSQVSAALRSDDPSLLASIPAPGTDDALLPLYFATSLPNARDALLPLDDGRVVHIAPDGATRVVCDHALAVMEHHGRILVACNDPAPTDAHLPGVAWAIFGANRARAVLTASAPHRVAAITSDAQGLRWRVERLDSEPITLAPGEVPVGASMHVGVLAGELIVLDATRTQLLACGPAARRRLMHFSEAIASAAVSPAGLELAVVSRGGALRVWALPSMKLRVARGQVECRP